MGARKPPCKPLSAWPLKVFDPSFHSAVVSDGEVKKWNTVYRRKSGALSLTTSGYLFSQSFELSIRVCGSSWGGNRPGEARTKKQAQTYANQHRQKLDACSSRCPDHAPDYEANGE